MPGQAVSGLAALTASGGGAGPQPLRTTAPVSRRGEGQAGPVLLFEKHKHGDARDAAGALPEFKGDEVLAATMRAPVEGEGDKLNAAVGPGVLPWRHSWSAVLGGALPQLLRGSSPQSSLEVCAGTSCGAGHPEPE